MAKLKTLLQGKKTYLVTALTILVAVLMYLNGLQDLETTIYAVLGALGLSTVRAGSKSDAKAVVESRPTNDPAAIP